MDHRPPQRITSQRTASSTQCGTRDLQCFSVTTNRGTHASFTGFKLCASDTSLRLDATERPVATPRIDAPYNYDGARRESSTNDGSQYSPAQDPPSLVSSSSEAQRITTTPPGDVTTRKSRSTICGHGYTQCAETDTERMHIYVERERRISSVLLIGVSGIDAAILGFSSGIAAETLATRCVVYSVVVAGLGLGINAYVQLIYSSGENQGFEQSSSGGQPHIRPAVARLPILFALGSAAGLSFFLLTIAYSITPKMTVTICGVTAALLGLEYIVKIARFFGRTILVLLARVRRAI